MKYSDCKTAFIGVLSDLLAYGSSVGPVLDPNSPSSAFGHAPKETVEQLGVSFTIANPRDPIIAGQHAQFDLGFGVGVLLWTLAGSEEQGWLRYYQSRSSGYLWVPWGKRLFDNHGSDQLALAIELLRRDAASRRAFLSIHDVEHLARPEKGVPCAAGIQFFVRGEALHAVGVMRAQNAFSSLRMDLFVLCTLQMLAADSLGMPIGSYTHMCTTLHCFEDEVEQTQNVIDGQEALKSLSLGNYFGFSKDVTSLLQFEHQLRGAVNSENSAVISKLSSSIPLFCSELAKNIASILLIVALRKTGLDANTQLINFNRNLANLITL